MKVPELLPRFAADRQARDVPAAGARAAALPAGAVPEDGDRRVQRLPRDARRRLRGLGRGGRPARGGRAGAAQAPLRRRRARRGLELDLEPHARAPEAGARRRRRADLHGARPARPRRPRPARGGRPARAQGRALGPGHASRASSDDGRRRGSLRRDPAGRHPRPPPVPLVRLELRGVRRVGRQGSRRRRDQDDRVPHRRGLAAGPRADRRVRGGQAERLPRRAEGALRRAPQHRVVARDGAGRRPRRLRDPEPQDRTPR